MAHQSSPYCLQLPPGPDQDKTNNDCLTTGQDHYRTSTHDLTPGQDQYRTGNHILTPGQDQYKTGTLIWTPGRELYRTNMRTIFRLFVTLVWQQYIKKLKFRECVNESFIQIL